MAMLHVVDARAVDDCLMSIHSLDPALIRGRAACLRCSGRGWLSHVDPLSCAIYSVRPRRCSIAGSSSLSIVIWPCCMLLMLGPWTARVHSLSCRDLAMLHAADARAMDSSCPLSLMSWSGHAACCWCSGRGSLVSTLVLRCDLRVLVDACSIAGSPFTFVP